MNDVVVKTFNDSGCLAHLIGCAATREALLVDPKVGRSAVYQKALADYGLKLVAVLDTHTHADHLSDSVGWIGRGVPLWMGAKTQVARPHRSLDEGELVAIGKLVFQVLELPGHTPDSIGLYGPVNLAAPGVPGPRLVLTGDTLFAGGLARADFRGSDPARLFESVKQKLLTLPDATVVLPGHGYQDVLFTTIGHERKRNAALQHADGKAYAAALHAIAGNGNTPDVDATLATNQAADPKLPAHPVAVAACCSMGAAPIAGMTITEKKVEELAPQRADVTKRKAWYDVRDPWELQREGRIPGAINRPLSELGFHLDELAAAAARAAPIVISCKSGGRSMTAAKTLAYLGVLKEPISMAGGFGRWKELGQPIE